MKTVADPEVLSSLVGRLTALTPDSRRRWGTLTPHEMLCHLGDATDMVLGVRPRKRPIRLRRRPVMKLFWLWLPVPWPHGVSTNSMHDPRREGTRPSDFARDLARAIRGIQGLAVAAGDLEPGHGMFGVMSRRDWQRWVYRHTNYHLRQFGL